MNAAPALQTANSAVVFPCMGSQRRPRPARGRAACRFTGLSNACPIGVLLLANRGSWAEGS
ncbi:hypothetical protein BDW62DRAFT_178027 [Aspergillus aurantiobrunneus]